MSGWELSLLEPGRTDFDAASMTALESCVDENSVGEIILTSPRLGKTILLRQLFRVRKRSDDNIIISGDVSFLHRLGFGWTMRSLRIEGHVGTGLGTSMRGGCIDIRGNTSDSAACQMRGGLIRITGQTGDYLGGPLPGRRSGMSGGRVLISGSAGHHAGHRMRRGTIVILGVGGDGVASDMVAGTIAVGGQVGEHAAAGMKRGTLILNQPAALDPVRFTSIRRTEFGIARLLADDLFADAPEIAIKLRRSFERSLGDLSAGGCGEVLTLR